MKDNKKEISVYPDRLIGYLAAAVSAGTLAGTSQAAIVSLDVSTIDGENHAGPVSLSSLAAPLTGAFFLSNGSFFTLKGFILSGMQIAAGSPSTFNYSAVRNFSYGETIDSSMAVVSNKAVFEYSTTFSSPAFGAGSFIGFRSGNGHYGWLEVTWDPSMDNYQILSGAYEDVAGVGLPAGALTAVPEPAGSLGTLGLLSAGMFVRRRRLAA